MNTHTQEDTHTAILFDTSRQNRWFSSFLGVPTRVGLSIVTRIRSYWSSGTYPIGSFRSGWMSRFSLNRHTSTANALPVLSSDVCPGYPLRLPSSWVGSPCSCQHDVTRRDPMGSGHSRPLHQHFPLLVQHLSFAYAEHDGPGQFEPRGGRG